jgi:hypothetical protein
MLPTLLYWDGHRGAARYDGVHIELRHNPFKHYLEFDYSPGVCTHVREAGGERRDMRPDEETFARLLLERLARDTRRRIEPEPPCKPAAGGFLFCLHCGGHDFAQE